ncbi:MAG: bifunctional demethylmenaquinone methyltransferase/2-methoxy-6-polyprenyl-1,4-benzoquinol methylase UbiE [Bacteroidia bacterium]|nr:bifunctional demethylmenaquinone methyltransferase/2-methoxy-6-polyprenyl-1,4-benzoquinol methylase UbiE [Bacteroidia bacterium]MCO5253169.1 bifunctional demethylmenaquinone methyltransferase/2-methoxy-6-polyprenyl-1,4-benzoquinol methylase UbiE [Bacteroidota bacterium]
MQEAQNTVKPDMSSELGKKDQVVEMFDSISKRYDFLNRFLSLGIDQSWRRKAIQSILPINPKKILDVATGTADLAIAATKYAKPESITGVDISPEMLNIGKEKITKAGLTDIISLQIEDSTKLSFADNAFDAVTVGFGVRNFENMQAGLAEIFRVIKPGGMVAVLEFSQPTTIIVKQCYNFYFKTILPTWGRLVSGNNRAYSYLPASVLAFPDGQRFLDILTNLGFKQSKQKKLTFGICSLYTAIK